MKLHLRARLRYWFIKWAAYVTKTGSNWPIWTGRGWEVYHCGKWVAASQPPMIYNPSTQAFYPTSREQRA